MPFILLLYREMFYFDTFRVQRSNRKLHFPVTLTPHLATWGKAELFSELKRALCGMHGMANCFFRAVAQEITGCQEDHAELRVLVTRCMAHNPAQLSYYLTSSETMGQYLRTTKMD